MSFGITSDTGYKFNSSAITSIEAAVSAFSDMSATLKGVFGVVIAGEASEAVSLAGRAEISAFLCGDAGAAFGGE